MAQTAGGTYYAASSELVSSWPATSLDLANQLESRFAAKLTTPGAWTSYTPVLTATTTNPTLGTGSTATGAYTQIGKMIAYRWHLVFGSSMNAGSGTYRVSLPVNSNRPGPIYSGTVFLFDSSTSNAWIGTVDMAGSTIMQLCFAAGGSFSTVTNAVPWAWAQSDQISGFITYEAA